MHRYAFLLAAALAAAPALAQQAPPRRPAPATGRGLVRGVVYDSLIRAPLEGARVAVAGTGIAATTDAGGRFRLDSVPTGVRTLLVEHPALDSVGLSGLAARVQVASARPAVVEIGVPSLWTMRRAVCPVRPAPLARDTAFAYGTLTDVRTGARLAGARVVVAWTTAGRAADGSVQVSRPTVEVRTDSLGNFYACDLPTDLFVTVQARVGEARSGVVEILIPERAVARRDLTIDLRVPVVDSVSGLRRGAAVLAGRVSDEQGQPRPSARVSVDDALGEVLADSGGRFVMGNLPAGSHMLMVRMIGYAASRQVVDLRDGDTTVVSVALRSVTVLDTLRVIATRRAANELDELELRARAGFGYRVDAEDLRRRATMRSVFQGIPNLNVSGRSVYNFRLSALISGRECAVNLFIDGIRGSVEELQSYRPEQLIALEYFPRPEMAPARFQVAMNNCPVALVWTRFIR